MILGPEDLERGDNSLINEMREFLPLADCEYFGELPATFLVTPDCLQLIAEAMSQPWTKN